MPNRALDTNPPAGSRHITVRASNWLFAVFALMLYCFFAVLFWSHLRDRRHPLYHQIPVIVLAVSSIAYFSMASDLGFTVVRNGFATRQVWFVRYIQWFINAAVILLGLLALADLNIWDIVVTIFFAWVFIISGLVGALVPSSYKWGYYAFGLAALFYVWYRLFSSSTRNTLSTGSGRVRTGYWGLATYIAIIWTLYPICWGLSEGSDTITPTSEMIFYGILDIVAGPVFLAFFLHRVSVLDWNELRSYGGPSARDDAERKGPTAGGPGAGAGPSPEAGSGEAAAPASRA